MLTNKLPGTRIKELFERHGIYSRDGGCKCNDICALMDQWGPELCLQYIDQCVNVIYDSYNHWRKELGAKELISLAPNFIGLWIELGILPCSISSTIRAIIIWAVTVK